MMRFLVLLCSVNIFFSAAIAEEYSLDIAWKEVNVTGKAVKKITVNGSIPGPTLVFTEGEEAVVHVTNHLDELTAVHWHGILLPGKMDGVIGLNGFHGIKPGESFTYRFPVRQTGTYWYHAHAQAQEQDGLYGALVFQPRVPAKTVDRDYIVLLSDFTEEDSQDILANLKMKSDYYNTARFTLADFWRDVKERSFSRAWQTATEWGAMRMSRTDLADVSGYTFLVNGQSPEQNWTGLFEPGDRIRLRFINAAAMTIFDVRIPGLKMTVIEADGQPVEPIDIDEFRFGVAETYDVIVTPAAGKAYTIVAEPIDRSGFALGTLSPREDMKGEMPKQRPRTLLTMADMAMDHDMSGMDHSNMTDAEMEDMINDMKSGWAKTGAPPYSTPLDYKKLRFAGKQQDTRQPEREITLRLGGNMERYLWTLNGKTMAEAEPFIVKYGERLRIHFINDSMMAHPMHLHGMFVQLENGQPMDKLPNKHTLVIPPAKTVSVLLTADEPGEWAFHCHLIDHMATGMMTNLVVTKEPHEENPLAHHAHEAALYHAFTLEADRGEGRDGAVSSGELDGWVGGDFHKLFVRSEVEREDAETATVENRLLYSYNTSEFWDLQAGIRYDQKPESVSYGVVGLHGLAPYWIETDAHVFFSEVGDITGRLELSHELLLNQHWVLEPRLQLDAGAGQSGFEAGLQLRHEFTRKAAFYLDLRHEEGEDSNDILAAGIKLMF